ncbi:MULTISPECIES: MFS transporter [Geobacillus]|uniref:MFS transporter n=1 Tax=Geobacillus thermocatenulatus TaxID=33938 RepID=A0A226Q0X7_9BACL|nr:MULTISPECIES: MFS transporter [Geobacillus]ASS99540.1 MFS transporter [Geobacillus thermocatenulatus]KLR73026.1 multidrug transporter [Geobacillus sp. T6]OXB85941.1 MFS transporter [Geobacillus thermocatenulatus]
MQLLFKKRGALFILMCNLLLVFIGVGLMIPVMPAFIEQLGISGGTVGWLVAVFSLTQFLCSPAAGKLADVVGRKKLMFWGMLLFAFSEWMFGYADHVFELFFSRVIGGISASLTMPAVMAYAADVTTNEERATGIGYINAAITMGFMIGPGIGGYMAEWGVRVPFAFAAVAGVTAAVVTALFLPESHSPESVGTGQKEHALFWAQLSQVHRQPYFFSLLILFALSFGLANFETIFSLFVDHRFGFSPKEIAFIVTVGSIAGPIVQLTTFSWLLRRFGEQRVVSACLLLSALFIMTTLLASTWGMLLAATVLVFLAIDILRPAVSTQMSKIDDSQQGYMAGLNSAFTSLGMIVGPIVAGVLFDVDMRLPYIVASAVLFLCFCMSLWQEKSVMRKASGQASRVP